MLKEIDKEDATLCNQFLCRNRDMVKTFYKSEDQGQASIVRRAMMDSNWSTSVS